MSHPLPAPKLHSLNTWLWKEFKGTFCSQFFERLKKRDGLPPLLLSVVLPGWIQAPHHNHNATTSGQCSKKWSWKGTDQICWHNRQFEEKCSKPITNKQMVVALGLLPGSAKTSTPQPTLIILICWKYYLVGEPDYQCLNFMSVCVCLRFLLLYSLYVMILWITLNILYFARN